MATVITNIGKGVYNNRLKNGATGATEPNFIGWGTGTGAVITGTALAAAASEARTAGTSSLVTTTTTNDTYQVVGTLTVAGAGKTISEVGLFDASTAGALFLWADFTGIALDVGESIQFTLKTQLI
jgi:hypothetical protein